MDPGHPSGGGYGRELKARPHELRQAPPDGALRARAKAV